MCEVIVSETKASEATEQNEHDSFVTDSKVDEEWKSTEAGLDDKWTGSRGHTVRAGCCFGVPRQIEAFMRRCRRELRGSRRWDLSRWPSAHAARTIRLSRGPMISSSRRFDMGDAIRCNRRPRLQKGKLSGTLTSSWGVGKGAAPRPHQVSDCGALSSDALVSKEAFLQPENVLAWMASIEFPADPRAVL